MAIRCVCPNGHPLKVKDQLAGQTGSCPTCGAEFTVPAAETTPGQIPPAAEPGPPVELVEWRLAGSDGQQYGPVGPEDFADWVRGGRVAADALVWRTGWAEWRHASDAASDLPAALPGSVVPAPPVPAPPVPPAPGAALDESKPEIAPQAPNASAYQRQRQRQRRFRRRVTIGLAVVCLLLIAMLIGLMLSGPPTAAPVVVP